MVWSKQHQQNDNSKYNSRDLKNYSVTNSKDKKKKIFFQNGIQAEEYWSLPTKALFGIKVL